MTSDAERNRRTWFAMGIVRMGNPDKHISDWDFGNDISGNRDEQQDGEPHFGSSVRPWDFGFTIF